MVTAGDWPAAVTGDDVPEAIVLLRADAWPRLCANAQDAVLAARIDRLIKRVYTLAHRRAVPGRGAQPVDGARPVDAKNRATASNTFSVV